ncbi:MAG: hypothetical protein BWX83_00592 [Candidatus Cloacimonetes bacterium ADurb.Bin117]|nr:MAG: hypothetical protein BWX83_00592 [Candidatus Cloacimonetes bacterium ADurb.Bin117]
MEGFLRVFQLGNGEVGNGYEPFHNVFADLDVHQHAFGNEFADLAYHFGVDGQGFVQMLPGIGMQLFHAQGDAVQGTVDRKDHGLHFLAFVVNFARMVDALGPADVGYVDQTIDAVRNFNKSTKGGEAFHGTGDNTADGVMVLDREPGIGFHLLHAQGDATVFLVQFQHDGVHGVAHLHYLAGVGYFFGPAHFRDVHQAFHAGFKLHKSSEGFHADHFAGDAHALGVFDGHVFPRMRHQLFHAEGDFIGFGIEFDHFHFHLVADVEHVGGVVDLAPAHVGEVEEAVDAAQIDESAVLGYIFHLAVKLDIHLDPGEQFFAFDPGFFFQYHLSGEDDIAVLLVDVHHLELKFLADELVEVGNGFYGHMGAG